MEIKNPLMMTVIISIFGVLALLMISSAITLKPMRISEIDESFIGKSVLVSGSVASVNSNENRTMIYLDESDTPLIIFSEIGLKKEDRVLVTGRVDEHGGLLQLVVDKIEISQTPAKI